VQVSAWLFLLQQGCCAGCVLAVTGQAAGLGRIFPCRLIPASLFLALCSLFCVLQPAMQLPALAAAMLAPLGAWPKIPGRMRPRIILLHLFTGLMLAGCARLVFSLPAAPLLQLPLLCLLLYITPRLLQRCSAPQCISIRIGYQGRRLSLTALVDSGNLLRDPLTHLPVIVISRKAASRLLPSVHELEPGMRLIRVRTVAGSTLMPILRPEQLELSQQHRWISTEAIVGLSPDGYNGFQALVPSQLLLSAHSPDLPSISNKEVTTP